MNESMSVNNFVVFRLPKSSREKVKASFKSIMAEIEDGEASVQWIA
jgi:hypothetical protein